VAVGDRCRVDAVDEVVEEVLDSELSTLVAYYSTLALQLRVFEVDVPG